MRVHRYLAGDHIRNIWILQTDDELDGYVTLTEVANHCKAPLLGRLSKKLESRSLCGRGYGDRNHVYFLIRHRWKQEATDPGPWFQDV